MSDTETTKVTETGPAKTVETTKPAPTPSEGGQSGGNGSDKPNG